MEDDEHFNFDLERIDMALSGGSIRIPTGLNRVERREWIINNQGKCYEDEINLKETKDV